MAIRQILRHLWFGRPDGIRRSLFRILVEHLRAAAGQEPEVGPAQPPPEPHTEPSVDLEGFIRVAESADVEEEDPYEVMVDGISVVLVRVDGVVHGVDGTCPHAGAALGDGDLDDGQLVCPMHGWAFDATTGACAVDRAFDVPLHPVHEHDGGVWVRPVSG